MTQEEKELLLKDLSARLPYGVKVEIISYGQENLKPWFGKLSCKDLDCFIHDIAYESIKPYLRPMSSMTDEEEYEYHQIKKANSDKSLALMDYSNHLQQLLFPIIVGTESIDWLNKKMFDYRGLIEKGLALEAPEGMY